MHELGLTHEIVMACSERAAPRRVTRVTVEVGALTCVLPDAMRFCFELCAAGTVVEGAELEIVRIPGEGRCRQCERNFEIPQLGIACPCGSFAIEITRGEELLVRRMEVR
jgi:hydrogenase nickel incorporation protein HypA/HybF